jgi:hypothetical protein
MIQCFNCEDWFHNTHLMPPVLTNDIDDKYVLICRRCICSKAGWREAIRSYSQFIFNHEKQTNRVEQKCEN